MEFLLTSYVIPDRYLYGEFYWDIQPKFSDCFSDTHWNRFKSNLLRSLKEFYQTYQFIINKINKMEIYSTNWFVFASKNEGILHWSCIKFQINEVNRRKSFIYWDESSLRMSSIGSFLPSFLLERSYYGENRFRLQDLMTGLNALAVNHTYNFARGWNHIYL